MRIAQVAPLYESCPPRLYGGSERVVSYLTEELVRQGHEVTLFATGDSCTAATLEPGCEVALWRDERVKDPLVYHLMMLDRVRRREADFDIIHCHTHSAPISISICESLRGDGSNATTNCRGLAAQSWRTILSSEA